MNFSSAGYTLISVMIAVGVVFLAISIYVNFKVARSVLDEKRHRERLYEYYRNTFSQLGIILIGVGVSLFIFFFQQSFLIDVQRETQYRQVLAKMATQVAKAATVMDSVAEYDEFLDVGGPYLNPEDGGNNLAVVAEGPTLVRQVENLIALRRDADLQDVGVMKMSDDFEGTQVINEMDPRMWAATVQDEAELDYGAGQLQADFRDLDTALAGDTPEEAVASERGPEVKKQMLDVLYDLDLVRDRSRRLLGRGCWFLSQGLDFVHLQPLDALDRRTAGHREWLDVARKELSQYEIGKESCYSILSPPH